MTHTLKGQLKARLDKQLVSLREHFAGAIADLPKQGGYTQEQLAAFTAKLESAYSAAVPAPMKLLTDVLDRVRYNLDGRDNWTAPSEAVKTLLDGVQTKLAAYAAVPAAKDAATEYQAALAAIDLLSDDLQQPA